MERQTVLRWRVPEMEAVDGGKAGGPEFPCAGGSCRSLPATSESVQSKAAIQEVVNALSWLHQVAGWGTRILAQPKVRKEPVTAEMLKAMVDAAGPEPSLSEVRLLAVCLLAFAGFLRCEKLLKLVCAMCSLIKRG